MDKSQRTELKKVATRIANATDTFLSVIGNNGKYFKIQDGAYDTKTGKELRAAVKAYCAKPSKEGLGKVYVQFRDARRILRSGMGMYLPELQNDSREIYHVVRNEATLLPKTTLKKVRAYEKKQAAKIQKIVEQHKTVLRKELGLGK